MSGTAKFSPGNYMTIPAVFQYSGGVAAEPGFEIERVTFRSWLPLAEGFARVEAHLKAIGRPLTSFCACELRSPAQFSEAGFIAFNQHYCETLARWGIYDPVSKFNPVARSNVCPLVEAPSEPGFYAFSYTVPSRSKVASFVISGSGEAPEGKGAYGNFIVRRGETTPDAMRDKARSVLDEMERRMSLLGFTGLIRRRRRSTRSTIFIRFSARRSYSAAPRGPASTGIWHDRQSSNSSMRWTVAVSPSSVPSEASRLRGNRACDCPVSVRRRPLGRSMRWLARRHRRASRGASA